MTEILIVDGYNIIHSIPELERELGKSLKNARDALHQALLKYQTLERSIKRIYVVYDSKNSSEGEMEDLGLVKNIYTPSSRSADNEIVALLKNAKKPSRISVLSRDNFVTNHTRAMGANILSPDEFCKKISKREKLLREGGLSQEEKANITKELKKIWKID